MKTLQRSPWILSLVLALFALSNLALAQAQGVEPSPPAAEATPVVDAAALETTPPTEPMGWTTYSCEALGTTDTEWGMGSDCTAALADLQFNLKVAGANECADLELLPCGITNTVIVTACHLYQGSYRTDGYATFKCRIYD
jgi:hypothetical protein